MAGMETSSNLQSLFMEAMRKVQEKTATYMEGEISPDKYKHFYNVWMETLINKELYSTIQIKEPKEKKEGCKDMT
jgi:hypothetical protein